MELRADGVRAATADEEHVNHSPLRDIIPSKPNTRVTTRDAASVPHASIFAASRNVSNKEDRTCD